MNRLGFLIAKGSLKFVFDLLILAHKKKKNWPINFGLIIMCGFWFWRSKIRMPKSIPIRNWFWHLYCWNTGSNFWSAKNNILIIYISSLRIYIMTFLNFRLSWWARFLSFLFMPQQFPSLIAKKKNHHIFPRLWTWIDEHFQLELLLVAPTAFLKSFCDRKDFINNKYWLLWLKGTNISARVAPISDVWQCIS